MSEKVKIKASDGHELDAYVVKPQGTPIGGLVVVQEIFGVNHHIRSVADNFAHHGFFVVAPALFDRVERNFERGYEGEDMKKGAELAQKLEIDNSVKDVEAALEYAKKQTGKTASVVGYCFGGMIAWLSSTRLKPASAVGYYGGGIAKFANETPKVPVMLHFGKQDTHIPLEDVDKVAKAHPEVQIFLYDAGHGFNCSARSSHNEAASKTALERTLKFLKDHAG
jgi:carboxymethylenebutenolidase